MGTAEGKAVELFYGVPLSRKFRGERSCLSVNKRVLCSQYDPIVRDRVFDGGKLSRFQGTKAEFGSFAADAFEVGKFPEVAIDEFGGSFPDED